MAIRFNHRSSSNLGSNSLENNQAMVKHRQGSCIDLELIFGYCLEITAVPLLKVGHFAPRVLRLQPMETQ